jgi:hypothetical protein
MKVFQSFASRDRQWGWMRTISADSVVGRVAPGETPRHFAFDPSGQWLLVANQDSDTVAVFKFNISTGSIEYTGNQYDCPSVRIARCCRRRIVRASAD